MDGGALMSASPVPELGACLAGSPIHIVMWLRLFLLLSGGIPIYTNYLQSVSMS